MKILEGKVAVITGASRGLGLEIARQFTEQGASVVLSSRNKRALKSAAEALGTEKLKASAFACDVSDPQQVERLARFAIDTYGGFDIWVNNAGVAGPYGATLDVAADRFLQVLGTNVLGVYYGSATAMRHFLPRRAGKLINIVGAGDRGPNPNQNAYGSSKAWIRNFSLALAREYKDSGVGIYVLQPGLMETELLTEIETFSQHEQRLRRFLPFLIRAAGKSPTAPARKVLWLASSATDKRTGIYVRLGSMLMLMAGFFRQGLRSLFHLPVREVPLNIKILTSAFEPLPGKGQGKGPGLPSTSESV